MNLDRTFCARADKCATPCDRRLPGGLFTTKDTYIWKDNFEDCDKYRPVWDGNKIKENQNG